MTKVCVLASGSKGNAVYVANDDTAILIDAGLPGIEIERRFASRDIHPAALDAVVVSHEHRDHISGVGVLSRRFGIPVFINEPTWKVANPLLGSLYETTTFRRGMPFAVGSFTIHPFSVSHDAVDPVAFTISDGSGKIGIVTDLGVATQLVQHHLKGCRLMILEANHDLKMLEEGPYPWPVKQRIQSRLGHLSNEASRDLLGKVSDGQLEHVIIAHVSEVNNHPDKVLSVVHESVRNSHVRLTLAGQHRAGDMITLDTHDTRRV